MLQACARIGAIHSVVFGGFAAKELAIRVDAAQPKARDVMWSRLYLNTALPLLPQ